MEAVILAGGLGTRLRAAVPDLPKPMAPVAGRPFLEHLMDYWIGQGVSRFILSIGYLRELIQGHFGDAYRGVPVAYAVEETPLGTGGGVLLGLAQAQGETVLVANGDTFFGVDLREMQQRHQDCGGSLTMALRRIPHNDRYGTVVLSEQGRIERFEANPTGGPGIINGGVYLMQRSALLDLGWLPGAKVALEQDLFPALLARDKTMCGLVSDGPFIDIGVPDDYYRAATVLPN